jgi:hypothetical protein
MTGNCMHNGDGAHPDGDADGLGPNGLDPELLQLFESTARHEAAVPGVFVNSLMLKIQQDRRLHLTRQAAGITAIMVGSAFLAPYVAHQTLTVTGWFADGLPATGTALVSPIGLLCAALVTWGVARRARTY